MRRVVIPELLDSDAGTADEISTSLGDLRRINRWFGGVRTSRAMIERVVRRTGQPKLSLLDVAAGSGDVAMAVQRQMQRQGVQLMMTLLDRSVEHLRHGKEDARSLDSRQRRALARDDKSYVRRSLGMTNREGRSLAMTTDKVTGAEPRVRRVAGDALALPFANDSFDFVSCALFTHHLEPTELRRFCAEALRVCRVAVLINDLRRSWVSLALVYAGFPLFRSRLTRHDGPASVRRAYTTEEIRAMLGETAAQRVQISSHYLFRMGVIIWK